MLRTMRSIASGSADVDRPAFPEFRVGRLYSDVPAGCLKAANDFTNERCVRLVEKPIQSTAAPSHNRFPPSIESGEHASKGVAG